MFFWGDILYTFFKRIIDIIISLCAMIVVIPVIIIVWVVNLFGENKGPVFFRQQRVGKNHKIFYIYKFRSMVVDAEKKLKTDKELYNLYVQNNYKLPPELDPRITKFGSFLRTTSIDELPQFFNILKGDMSLIGPRPVVEEELQEYGDRLDKFFAIIC